jgi:hypothetical protein
MNSDLPVWLSPDTPTIDLCDCTGFRLWYVEDQYRVCYCGHPDAEHLDGHGSCIGRVEIR